MTVEAMCPECGEYIMVEPDELSVAEGPDGFTQYALNPCDQCSENRLSDNAGEPS